jgi:hypothetical protein
MLPYLLIQLLLVTLLAVLHTMLALVAPDSTIAYGFLVVTICSTFIGKTSVNSTLLSFKLVLAKLNTFVDSIGFLRWCI